MSKWIGFLSNAAVLLTIFGFGTMFQYEKASLPAHMFFKADTDYVVSQENVDPEGFPINTPVLGKSLTGFKEALGFKESRGNYTTVNTLGYLGKYQFGKGTLQILGINNTQEFLDNPSLQEEAFLLNMARNKWILRRDIKRFVGKTINGVRITESGIIAAAHLGGAGNVKKYLRSYGQDDFSDAFGSNVARYIKYFGGYDIADIKAKKNPKYQG